MLRQALLPRWLHEQYAACTLDHPRVTGYSDSTSPQPETSGKSSLGIVTLPFSHTASSYSSFSPHDSSTSVLDSPLPSYHLSVRTALSAPTLTRATVAWAIVKEIGYRMLARVWSLASAPVDAVEAAVSLTVNAVKSGVDHLLLRHVLAERAPALRAAGLLRRGGDSGGGEGS